MTIRSIILILISSMLCSCAYFRDKNEKLNTTGYNLAEVQRDLKSLDLSAPYTPTPAVADYLNFYGLNATNAQHFFGTLQSEGQTLAAHVFIPPEPRGTLFMIHGYFDHTGTLAKLISAGLGQHYAIVSWDLPGHGLSSGARTDTGQFNLCAKQFIDLVGRSEGHLPSPMYLIAHSTGCSIYMEYIQNPAPDIFDGVVFLAPLVRHAYWGWGKFGYAISNPFVNKVRRREKKNSTDAVYLAFVKRDPLHSDILSYDYLSDLYAWEKKTRTYSDLPDSLCIIQGDKDKVVNWKYNIPFLQSKFETVDLLIVPGAKHQLANESEIYRKPVFEKIFAYLEEER